MRKLLPILIMVIAILVSCVYFIHQTEKTSTELIVVNKSPDTALVYLTLSGYPSSLAPNYIQDVNGVLGCTQTGLVGSFYLAPGDSASYFPIKRLSGNLCFGSQPINCPDSLWPTGVNLFEFNLNCPQESIDISAVSGVNCILEVDLIGGPNWPAAQYTNPRHFYNDSMYKNTGLVGVFPLGCTNCVNTQGKQACITSPETPNTTHICNPTRAKNQHGGAVRVSFKGFTNKNQ